MYWSIIKDFWKTFVITLVIIFLYCFLPFAGSSADSITLFAILDSVILFFILGILIGWFVTIMRFAFLTMRFLSKCNAFGYHALMERLTAKPVKKYGKWEVAKLADRAVFRALKGDLEGGRDEMEQFRTGHAELLAAKPQYRYFILRALANIAQLAGDRDACQNAWREAESAYGMMSKWQQWPMRVGYQYIKAASDLLVQDDEAAATAFLEKAATLIPAMDQAESCLYLIMHYVRTGQSDQAEEYTEKLRTFFGNAAFMTAAGCPVVGKSNKPVFIPKKAVFDPLRIMPASVSVGLISGGILAGLITGFDAVMTWLVIIFAGLGTLVSFFLRKRMIKNVGLIIAAFGILTITLVATLGFRSDADIRNREYRAVVALEEALVMAFPDPVIYDDEILIVSRERLYVFFDGAMTEVWYSNWAGAQIETQMDGSEWLPGILFFTGTDAPYLWDNEIMHYFPDEFVYCNELAGDQFILVNLTEASINAVPAADGRDQYLFAVWDPGMKHLTIYEYWK